MIKLGGITPTRVKEDTKRIDFESLLESLGFESKVSTANPSKKRWMHSKISYIIIFTNVSSYTIRLFSAESSHYDTLTKEYRTVTSLVDILTDC